VRELENVISRAVLRASAGRGAAADARRPLTIDTQYLDVSPARAVATDGELSAPRSGAPPAPLRALVEDFERGVILAAVERHAGNWAAAARDLGLHRSNLHQLARRLGLRSNGIARR
jgi:anaerobic nitric oxide reductase transcription regulator